MIWQKDTDQRGLDRWRTLVIRQVGQDRETTRLTKPKPRSNKTPPHPTVLIPTQIMFPAGSDGITGPVCGVGQLSVSVSAT